ncbi:LytR/AlgR family response regulator transcription factor [Alteromonas halophila]|uniref:HTH LytTR-type domain-containing protein n=1 Tax=Alteromonas halophila TaxID=516698 RepID=A0A918JF88_9ALTE|nr:LytTR family DNA-binding domain-containing protein [Alteromonas halophila]GGW72633.1 hypothetical protein GCM10007391_00100 [Alteromonas halophila]
MQTIGHSLGLGLTPFRLARFSSNVTPAGHEAGVTEELVMRALVYYPNPATSDKLVFALKQTKQFETVRSFDALARLHHDISRFPDAIVFTDLPTIRCSQQYITNRHDWIVLGEGNRDALEAFSTHAMSFLCVPLDESQITTCCNRLVKLQQTRHRQRQFSALKSGLCQQYGIGEAALAAMLRRQHHAQAKPDVVGVRSGNSWCCVSASEVRWIEAAGDYMCVHTTQDQHIVRSTLGALIKRFADTDFAHCNRSTVINLAYLHDLVWLDSGMLVAELADGTRIKISRRCFAAYWQRHPLLSET